MEEHYWISGIFAAAFIALLSGLGIGSGGLLVIWLTLILGIDAETARGLNLLFFVFSASAAFVVHFLKKRVRLPLVLFLSLFACLGTVVGTRIGVLIDPLWLRRIFGGMLILSGVYTLAGNLVGARRRVTARRDKF